TITVRVIVDWDRKPSASTEYVKQAIEFTNEELARNHFDIRLLIISVDAWNVWPKQNELDMNLPHGVDIESIARHSKGGADILLVYTPKTLIQEVSLEIYGIFELVQR